MDETENVQTNFSPENFNRSRFIDLVLPFMGAISYETFSLHIMNPKRFTAFFGDQHPVIADILWFNAHIGVGVYLYRQDIFKAARTPWRITYSVFGSALFNFGSVLMWGTSRALLPKVPERLKTLFGLGSGFMLLYVGWHLTSFLNQHGGKQGTSG